jgi:hypothetical protein
MGREGGGTMLGGGFITADHGTAWDHVGDFYSDHDTLQGRVPPAALDAWNHVAMTYDGEVVHFYVNGVQQGGIMNDSGDLVTAAGALRIGGVDLPDGRKENFVGMIDEVRVIKAALQPADVAALCDCDVQPFTSSSTLVHVGKYALIDTPMLWADAIKYCKANGFSTMATVHSAAEDKQVRQLCAARTGNAANPASPCTCEGNPLELGADWEAGEDVRGCNCAVGDQCAVGSRNNNADVCVGSCGCWVGLLSSANALVWSDGTEVDYSNWFDENSRAFNGGSGGEPNNSAEGYVELRMCCDGYACMHGQWNDMSDTPQPFICERSTTGPLKDWMPTGPTAGSGGSESDRADGGDPDYAGTEIADLVRDVPRLSADIVLDGDLADWNGVPYTFQTPFRSGSASNGQTPTAFREFQTWTNSGPIQPRAVESFRLVLLYFV